MKVRKKDVAVARIGYPPGTHTEYVFIGRFRDAVRWAFDRGVHLKQWNLIEARTSLVVFVRLSPSTSTMPAEAAENDGKDPDANVHRS